MIAGFCVVQAPQKGGKRYAQKVYGVPGYGGDAGDDGGPVGGGPGTARWGADVCVSIKGDTKVDKGASGCVSDATSKAVAVKGSAAVATEDSKAHAVNDSAAVAFSDCTARAHNGEVEVCP